MVEDHLAEARRVADAVLYEGYLLYPYRASSAKNQVRWQFGVLMPEGCDGEGPEPWANQTECLLEAEHGATLEVLVRFLQVQMRTVEEADPGGVGGFRSVASLTVDGHDVGEWDEAVPQEVVVRVSVADALAAEQVHPVDIDGGIDHEVVHAAAGEVAGRVVRERLALTGVARVSAEEVGSDGAGRPRLRLRVRVENAGRGEPDEPRPESLRRALVSAHALLGVDRGAFASLTDPPPWAEAAARHCRNERVWPVLLGDEASSDLVLSSPIILPDDPQVAPESPGDLFDATEIDEILTLRVMTLSDDEKREVRATDERARGILERAETMPPDLMGKLHGAARSLRRLDGDAAARLTETTPEPAALPSGWEELGLVGDEPAPEDSSVVVAGVEVARGSRVVLHPNRRADPMDAFLGGKEATVRAVAHDVDGSVHVAVTVDDDPAADIQEWYRRYFYFSPDEVEPLAPAREGATSASRRRANQ